MDQEEFSLEALKSAVKEKEAKWEPAITSLSMLSDEEKTQRLGFMPTTTELELSTKFGLDKPITSRRRTTRTKKESNPGSAGLPGKWDWRNVSGVRWTSPIKDPGWMRLLCRLRDPGRPGGPATDQDIPGPQ